MVIKVFCKACRWTGQALVGKVGFPLRDYKCPDCGGSLKRSKGSYNYNSACAVLKKIKGGDEEMKKKKTGKKKTIEPCGTIWDTKDIFRFKSKNLGLFKKPKLTHQEWLKERNKKGVL